MKSSHSSLRGDTGAGEATAREDPTLYHDAKVTPVSRCAREHREARQEEERAHKVGLEPRGHHLADDSAKILLVPRSGGDDPLLEVRGRELGRGRQRGLARGL